MMATARDDGPRLALALMPHFFIAPKHPLRSRKFSDILSGNTEPSMIAEGQSSLSKHRARRERDGFVRVEVNIRREDASLVRGVASALCDPLRQAEARALLRQRFAAPPKVDLKALLASAPLDGIDLERNRDFGRDIDL